jgi:hypothetical protein
MEPAFPDSTVFHYRILGPLRTGGMGTVYLAEAMQLNLKAAIKTLKHNSSAKAYAEHDLRLQFLKVDTPRLDPKRSQVHRPRSPRSPVAGGRDASY